LEGRCKGGTPIPPANYMASHATHPASGAATPFPHQSNPRQTNPRPTPACPSRRQYPIHRKRQPLQLHPQPTKWPPIQHEPRLLPLKPADAVRGARSAATQSASPSPPATPLAVRPSPPLASSVSEPAKLTLTPPPPPRLTLRNVNPGVRGHPPNPCGPIQRPSPLSIVNSQLSIDSPALLLVSPSPSQPLPDHRPPCTAHCLLPTAHRLLHSATSRQMSLFWSKKVTSGDIALTHSRTITCTR